MRNKIKMCLLLTLLTITLTACGSSMGATSANTNEANQEEAKPTSEEVKTDISNIYKELDEVNTKCDFIVATVHDNWKSVAFQAMFYDETTWNSKKQYYNDEFIKECETIFQYREEIQTSLTEINSDIKALEVADDLDDLYSSLKDLYVTVNSYAEIATGYPEGYSLVSYTELYNSHKAEYEKLKGYVDLEL